jgi:hypothetical protein
VVGDPDRKAGAAGHHVDDAVHRLVELVGQVDRVADDGVLAHLLGETGHEHGVDDPVEGEGLEAMELEGDGWDRLVLDEVGEGAGDEGAEDTDTDDELLGLGLVAVHDIEEAQPEDGRDAGNGRSKDGAEVDGVIDACDELDEPGDEHEAHEAGHEQELRADEEAGSAERPPLPLHPEILRRESLACAVRGL